MRSVSRGRSRRQEIISQRGRLCAAWLARRMTDHRSGSELDSLPRLCLKSDKCVRLLTPVMCLRGQAFITSDDT